MPESLSLSCLAEAGFDPPDSSPSPEERWSSQQQLDALWNEILMVFDDDELAIDILEYDMAGYSAQEIMKDLGIDQRAYDSKRRLIRRRLDRHLKKEGGHEK